MFLSPLWGWLISRITTHGLRRGLYSFAASRLESGRSWTAFRSSAPESSDQSLIINPLRAVLAATISGSRCWDDNSRVNCELQGLQSRTVLWAGLVESLSGLVVRAKTIESMIADAKIVRAGLGG